MSLTPSIKRRIMTALAKRMVDLNYFKIVETNHIRILAADFADAELPACQFIGVGEEISHEHNRVKKLWVIHLEVVMKSSENGYVTQYDLWDCQEAIEAQFGAQVQLKDIDTGIQIPGVVDINLRGTVNDLHMQEPYYTLRMELIVRHYTNFTGTN